MCFKQAKARAPLAYALALVFLVSLPACTSEAEKRQQLEAEQVRAKAEKEKRRDDQARAYWQANRQTIVPAIEALIDSKDWEKAHVEISRYYKAADGALDQLDRKNKISEVQSILAETNANDVVNQLELNQRLVALDPTNRLYQQNVAMYMQRYFSSKAFSEANKAEVLERQFVGRSGEEVLVRLGEARSTSIVGRDANGLLVEWRYSRFTLLMARREQNGQETYRVVKATPN